MSAAIPPPGVYVPTPVLFKPSNGPSSLQDEIDLDATVKHSVWLAQNGIMGLVLMGSTGEAIHLSRAERIELVKSVREGLDKAGFKDYPIMAGVLTNGLAETLEWLADYTKAGAQWGLVLTPGYFGAGVTQNNIREYYVGVAERSEIPIVIYNYPGVANGVVVTPETYRSLAAHPNIVGCKMSHGNVSHHLQVSLDPQINHDTFRVYSGFGQQLAPVMLFGAAGVVDALAGFYPRTVVELMKHAQARYLEEHTRELQYAVCLAEEYVALHGVVGIREAVIRLAGFGTLGAGRYPLRGRLTEGEWEKGRALYLGLVEREERRLRNEEGKSGYAGHLE